MQNLRPEVRLVVALLTHVTDIVSQILTMLVFSLMVSKPQLWASLSLASLWLADISLHAAEAWREGEAGMRGFKWTLRAILFGFIRWSQVRRILEVYQKSSDRRQLNEQLQPQPPSQPQTHTQTQTEQSELATVDALVCDPALNTEPLPTVRPGVTGAREVPLIPPTTMAPVADRHRPTFIHGKTSHSVVTAFPFALMSLYGFCVIDSIDEACPWHIHVPSGRLWLGWVLGVTGLVSINCIAGCALEVDYALSGWVSSQVNASMMYSTLHIFRRWFEVAYRLALLIILAVIMRTVGYFRDKWLLGPIVLCLPAAVCWFINTLILCWIRPAGTPRDAFLAHAGVGLVALVLVPTTFVDVSGYRAAAQNVTTGLWIVQSLAMASLLVVAFVVMQFNMVDTSGCDWESGIRYFLPAYLVHLHKGLLISSGISLFMYIVLTIVSRACYGRPAERHDGAVLKIKPSQSRAVESQSLQVRCPRGLSSLLLHVTVGATGNMFEEAEEYVIEYVADHPEGVLGKGQFGVVVQVRQESRRPGQATQKFAVKLHSGSRREAELLAIVDHPFCVEMLDHFRVLPNQTFWFENGDEVLHHAGRFEHAIRMELCTAGTLEGEIAKHWCRDSGPAKADVQNNLDLRMKHMQYLRDKRRLAAELAEVMNFLHSQNPPIVYRDLKPDNVLMKQGRDQQLHICLTDFGYAKRPSFEYELSSPAGNFLTAAPEVPRPWEARRPYTKKVDNWSLGCTILCMLWCTHGVDQRGRPFPVMPDRKLWKDEDDPRIPAHAARLIKTLTQKEPSMRGTMLDACRSRFFTEPFMHMGEEFQPINMQTLKDNARH